MDPINLRGVADGGELLRTSRGMVIVRRRKHEPIETATWTEDQLVDATSKERSSKFLAAWSVERVVEWLAVVIENHGWRAWPHEQSRLTIRLAEPVEVVRGRIVNTIYIGRCGRWVHAYPVEDED